MVTRNVILVDLSFLTWCLASSPHRPTVIPLACGYWRECSLCNTAQLTLLYNNFEMDETSFGFLVTHRAVCRSLQYYENCKPIGLWSWSEQVHRAVLFPPWFNSQQNYTFRQHRKQQPVSQRTTKKVWKEMAWSSKYLKQLGTNNKFQVSDWERKAKKINTKQSLDPLLVYHIFKDSSCPWEARHRGPVEGWGLQWQALHTRAWWGFRSKHKSCYTASTVGASSSSCSLPRWMLINEIQAQQ